MKKQIVLLGLLFLGAVYLCGMEECLAPIGEEFVTVETSDKKEFKLSAKLAQKSEMIRSMQDYQPEEPVVLHRISSQLFQLIKNVLESSNPQQVIMELTLRQLVGFIQAVNFLIIPDLIGISIQELAKHNLSQNELNMLFEQLAGDTIENLWSVHPAFKWILKGYKLSAKKLEGKNAIRFSPNGKYLLSASDGTIEIWDANNNFEQVGSDLQHADIQVAEVDFSPDGKYLVSCSKKEGTIKIWGINNNFEQVGSDLQHASATWGRFSPDENYFVSFSSKEGTIKIWNVNNNFEQVGNDLLQRQVNSVVFSPDGRYLVSRGMGVIKIWDVDNNFEQIGDDLLHDQVSGVKFSPDGRYLISSSYREETIKIWDVNNNFEQVGDDLLYEQSYWFTFSSDERYLVFNSSRKGAIKVLDMHNNFKQVNDDLLHDKVKKVVFSQDGRYLVSRGMGVIKIWDVNNNFEQIGDGLLHDQVTDVEFSPDGRYLISSSYKEETIKIWDVNNNFEQAGDDLFHDKFINTFFSPDGKYLVFRDDSSLAILDWSIFQHIVTPTLNQIHLFLLLYFAHTENQELILSVQLQQTFAYLPLKIKELLKQLAPEFENVFERAEKSFEID